MNWTIWSKPNARILFWKMRPCSPPSPGSGSAILKNSVGWMSNTSPITVSSSVLPAENGWCWNDAHFRPGIQPDGGRRQPKDKVFKGLTYSAYSNKHLAKWIGLAGITKEITFHCFRHTYATLQLSKGTDIYTVSKMLGHRSLKTTQVYARIIDEAKRDASNRIKLKFWFLIHL